LGALRKFALGKLKISARDFYDMTILEISDAIDGFNELEDERNQNYLEGVRTISYYAVIAHLSKKAKVKGPADLIQLKKDIKAKKDRIKKMKPIEVIRG
jgi:hypothetical protein